MLKGEEAESSSKTIKVLDFLGKKVNELFKGIKSASCEKNVNANTAEEYIVLDGVRY
jgi:hypothetical protein